jgi:hypothetical protein
MPDKLDSLNQLIASFVDALGIASPDSHMEQIIENLRILEENIQGVSARGLDIVSHLSNSPSPESKCRNLILECCDYDNGLYLLWTASEGAIKSRIKKEAFKCSLKAYAKLWPNQAEMARELFPELLHQESSLCFIDSLDEHIASGKVRQVVQQMAKPGAAFAQRLPEIQSQFRNSTEPEKVKQFLQGLLSTCPPSVIQDFQMRVAANSEGMASSSYLYILIEPLDGRDDNHPYRFSFELSDGFTLEPAGSNSERLQNGAWPEGRMEDFPRIAGEWLNEAKSIAPNKLYMEVFLPHKLLLDTEEIKIDIPLGSNWKSYPLYACGTPVMFRSWDRAEKAKMGRLGQELHGKWERMRQGNASLLPVFQDSQLNLDFLHPRLSRDCVAGILMLLDLPTQVEMRSDFLWTIINSMVPVCTWWRGQTGFPCTSDDDMMVTDRLKKLHQTLFLECLEFEAMTDLSNEPEDVPAPSGLHAMEAVADQLRVLSGDSKCREWIHQMLVLIDHPKRWPSSILYGHQPGGIVQSLF